MIKYARREAQFEKYASVLDHLKIMLLGQNGQKYPCFVIFHIPPVYPLFLRLSFPCSPKRDLIGVTVIFLVGKFCMRCVRNCKRRSKRWSSLWSSFVVCNTSRIICFEALVALTPCRQEIYLVIFYLLWFISMFYIYFRWFPLIEKGFDVVFFKRKLLINEAKR